MATGTRRGFAASGRLPLSALQQSSASSSMPMPQCVTLGACEAALAYFRPTSIAVLEQLTVALCVLSSRSLAGPASALSSHARKATEVRQRNPVY